MNHPNDRPHLGISWVWLLIAIATGFVSSGKWIVPLAAWINPVFMVRFLELQKGWKGFFVFIAAGYVGFAVTQHGLIPMPDHEFYVAALVAILIGYVPYALHRTVCRYSQGYWTSLVFPASVVSLEYLLSFGPYGTWGSGANTQYRNLTLIQLASITGIWGIVFLMSWTASSINWVWSRNFHWPTVRRPALLFTCIISAVFVFGQVRLFARQPTGKHVKVAGIVASSPAFSDPRVKAYIFDYREGHDVTPESELGFVAAMNERLDDQLQRSESAAANGAAFIYWSEVAVATLPKFESQLLRRGERFAAEHSVYLGMAFCSIRSTQELAFVENKIVLIGPDGDIVNEYLKSRIPPGEPSIAGNGKAPIVRTEYGTISNVICFDTDFPTLMRQPGKANTAIVFAPSNDWKEASCPHMAVASFRAVENGYSLVRITSNGISGAIDYLGNVKAQSNSFLSDTQSMSAELPTQGISTLYSKIGDVLPWMSIAFVMGVVPYTLMLRRQLQHTLATNPN